MTIPKQNINELLELANHYPSPHNGQPIRVKIINNTTFDLYFDKTRGLQATDISYLFSFVSMGVFVQHFNYAAQALGHKLEYMLNLPKENALRGVGIVKFARCHIIWHEGKPDDALRSAIISRQTSRKKYTKGVSDDFAAKVSRIAQRSRMELVELDSGKAAQAIWLNQRAVFDDMFDDPVRRELDSWLRYSQKEKQEKKDGLAYDCMELNGRIMKYITDHPRVLKMPGISGILKQYYTRTMTDASSVFYMLTPFKTEHDSFEAGLTIMQIWMEVASAGYYLHPFGTIMSNHNAHMDFLQLANIQDETRERRYLSFIFRCGKSKKPVPSLRIPYQEHLILE